MRRPTTPSTEERSEGWKLIWTALKRAQPAGKIPSWIILNVTTTQRAGGSRGWTFQMDLFRKSELGPGEYWQEEEDGMKTLRRVDPVTGQQWVVIDSTPEESERVRVFEGIVDLDSREVSIMVAMDVSTLDPEEFELYQDAAVARERLRSKLDAETYSLVFGDDA